MSRDGGKGPPRGDSLLGEVVVRASTSSLEDLAQQVAELLSIQQGDAILELGYGSGRMMSQIAARLRGGSVVGIDPAELMVRHARMRNRRAIAAGRAAVEQGDSAALAGFADARFDKVFGLHVIYFWTEPRRDLAEIHRVLRPNGIFLLGFWPAEAVGRSVARRERAGYDAGRASALLRENGFEDLATERRAERGQPLVWVRGRRPAG